MTGLASITGDLLRVIFAPGFFTNVEVQHALVVGLAVAAAAGVIGIFVVLRQQSFAGHALTDIGSAGASGAALAGINVWFGFLAFGLVSGIGMEAFGKRGRRDEISTGIVLSAALGIGALFLYLSAVGTSHASLTMLVLFGSIFVVDSSVIPYVAAASVFVILMVLLMFRPLLLTSLSPELAHSRGIRVRLLQFAFIILLAAAVEDAALVVGALLSTALLIGPAASAVRFTRSPLLAAIGSAIIGMVTTVAGIVLSYDSYTWPPYGRGWPVSFFVVALIMVVYMVARFAWRREGSRRVQRSAGFAAEVD